MLKKPLSVLILLVSSLLVSACSDAEPERTAQAAPAKTASAATPAPGVAREGEGFIRIGQPVHTANPDKIEVTEVFWYGCSHCFHFEPMLAAWAKKLPDDVDFRHSPAMWNPLMVVHAQAFYTAEALGVMDKVHQPLFDEINLRHNRLGDEAALATFFQEVAGVEPDKFKKTFNSFGVASQVKQADARARSYGIAGTPELIVNGKYRVTGKSAGSRAEMLKVAEELIAKERAAK
jgi:protein dithiol oxidoreductase (disulfide-forming)